MTRARVLALLAALAMLPALSRSVHAEDAEAGRRYFKRGQDLLRANDYRAAARAFEAGYAVAPRVGFLLNIGNCYRKLGELGKAREHYWRFLDAAPKDHPSRPAVMEYLRLMEQIEADGVSVDSAPARPGATLPPEVSMDGVSTEVPASAGVVPPALRAPAPVSPATGLTVVDVQRPKQPEHPSVFKRWWFWTALGGAVAAGAGAYLVTRLGTPAPSCAASLACVRE